MSMALGERRELARELREHLSLYLFYLTPYMRRETSAEVLIRYRRDRLRKARELLDQLIQLDAGIAEIEEQEGAGG